jgi:hypothetical protein
MIRSANLDNVRGYNDSHIFARSRRRRIAGQQCPTIRVTVLIGSGGLSVKNFSSLVVTRRLGLVAGAAGRKTTDEQRDGDSENKCAIRFHGHATVQNSLTILLFIGIVRLEIFVVVGFLITPYWSWHGAAITKPRGPNFRRGNQIPDKTVEFSVDN